MRSPSRPSRRASGSAAIWPTRAGSSLSRSRPKCSRGFLALELACLIARTPVDDLMQQRDQPVASVLAYARDHAALMRLEDRPQLAHQRDAVRRQIKRIGALVARLAPLGEPALFQLVEHADEIGTRDAQSLG